MSNSNSKRNQWIEKGWKRGAFVDLNSHPDLVDLMPEKLKIRISKEDQAYLIPILYDCSLIDECFEREPWVQALICWVCEEPDGNFMFGKNSRKIDFPVFFNDSELHLRSEAIGFCQIERDKLLKSSPTKELKWKNKGLEQILNWVSERYKQPTFPDEWNRRLDTKNKELKKLYKNREFNNSCSGLYFEISPFSEIAENQVYDVKAFFVISSTLTGPQHRDFVKNHENILIQQLNTILSSINNINSTDIDTIKEDQFTKAMERDFQRWQLEHISYKDINNSPLPAELHIK